MKKLPLRLNGWNRNAFIAFCVILGLGILFLALPVIAATILNFVFAGMLAAIILAKGPSGVALLATAFLVPGPNRIYRFIGLALLGSALGVGLCSVAGVDVHNVKFIDAGYADILWALGLIIWVALAPQSFGRWLGPLILVNFAASLTTQSASILTVIDIHDFAAGIWIPVTMYLACVVMISIVALLVGWLIRLLLRILPSAGNVSDSGNPGFSAIEARVAASLLLAASLAIQVARLLHGAA